MKRAIIYVRVSTEDQLEKYGLPAQLRACRELAASLGFTNVIEEIADEGFTGTNLHRPGIERVRRLIADQAIDAVIALDPDRLSRVLRDLLDIKAEADAARVSLEFVTASFDNSPTGELFFSIKGSIAAYERKLFLERCLRGKRERARSGRIVGGRVCYGYRYDDGRLVVDEEKAAWVRKIYAWYEAGLSIRAVTVRLREMGAPTHRGRKWGHSSVRRILVNETFAGVAHYDSHRHEKRDGKARRVANPLERWIPVSVPALVTREQWQRVQARMLANPQSGRPSTEYLLRGLLYCSCGKKMHGNTRLSRNERTYRCYGRDTTLHQGEPCRCAVNAKRLDAAVWEAITRAFSDVRVLRGLLADQERRLKRATETVDLRGLESQVRKLKAREERALALMLDADLADARQQIKRQYQDAQQQRIRIERELETQRRATAAPVLRGEWLEATVALLRADLEAMEDAAARQGFVRQLVTRAVWANRELRMSCFLGLKSGTFCSDSDQFPPLEFTLKARFAA